MSVTTKTIKALTYVWMNHTKTQKLLQPIQDFGGRTFTTINATSTIYCTAVQAQKIIITLSHVPKTPLVACVFYFVLIRAKRVSNWYTPQKKSARLPACTCQIILVLEFTYVSTTYVRTSARYQPVTKIRICIYVCARVGYVLCATYVRKLVYARFLYLASAGSHDTYM